MPSSVISRPSARRPWKSGACPASSPREARDAGAASAAQTRGPGAVAEPGAEQAARAEPVRTRLRRTGFVPQRTGTTVGGRGGSRKGSWNGHLDYNLVKGDRACQRCQYGGPFVRFAAMTQSRRRSATRKLRRRAAGTPGPDAHFRVARSQRVLRLRSTGTQLHSET